MNKLTVEDLKITLQMKLAEVDRKIQSGRCDAITYIFLYCDGLKLAWGYGFRAPGPSFSSPEESTVFVVVVKGAEVHRMGIQILVGSTRRSPEPGVRPMRF